MKDCICAGVASQMKKDENNEAVPDETKKCFGGLAWIVRATEYS